MRVLREIFRDPVKLQIFSWNGKLMLKAEYGPYEQWFKFPEEEVSVEMVERLIDEPFLKSAIERFYSMHSSAKESFQRNKE